MQIRLWRAMAATAVSAVTLTTLVGVGPAAAHPGDPHQNGAKHAADDLANETMEKIERDTKANKHKIKDATGVTPGGRTATQQVPNERASITAAADPGDGGQWSPVINTPVVPIFQAVLPNGKVLMWDSVGDAAAESYPDQTFTRAAVWDPKADTYKQVNVSGYNIFCSGFVQLADGRVLVAGGNKDQALDGIVQTHLFDWRTETWSRGPDMASGRWYPSVAPLNNGEAMIVAGGPATAEVYQTSGTLRQLTGFSSFANRIYPFLVPRPDDKVQLIGPDDAMNTMSTSGAGALTAAQSRDGISRSYGSFATYDVGKVLVAGGGDITEDGQTHVPTKTARVVDVNGSGTSVRSTSSMSVGRRQFNLTVLADGSVLATGGQSGSAPGSLAVDLDHPVFAAERWNPDTEAWTVLSSASRIREYHSAATLLPDGRVLTGGGGVCGICVTKGYLEKNLEYFTPPYLYKHDGSGALADRPVIDSAPGAIGYGRQFAIGTAQAGSIDKVGLVRLGASTHGDDQGQRYLPLPFTASGSKVIASSPATTGTASPGYYMLFVTDKNGVPSVAKIVRLDAKGGSRPKATLNDYDGDLKADAAVWNPSTGDWTVEGSGTTTLGAAGDQPVPADYGGDGRTDMAVWRPSTGVWSLRGIGTATLGRSTDKPVPADYDGDGRSEVAVWRPSTGNWYIGNRAAVNWGISGDIPVPADYNGDGKADIAVWRPSNGKWYVRGISTTAWGVVNDKPVVADYNGDGKADIAQWRPSTGTWYVKGISTTVYGTAKDTPVPGDYNGDGRADIAVWHPATASWDVKGLSSVVIGESNDTPAAAH